jgi:hypothetical protein
MLREIYCRNASEPGFNPEQYETSNAIEAILTKIKMILFTRRGEVAGHYDLGMNLEDLLFEFGYDGYRITDDFYAQLFKYVPDTANFKVDFKITFVPGTVRDIAYIDIYIDGTKYLGVMAK